MEKDLKNSFSLLEMGGSGKPLLDRSRIDAIEQ